MSRIELNQHQRGALSLQLSPGKLHMLQLLFREHSFWADTRTRIQIRKMLIGSSAAVSAWDGTALVGFGRATSDGIFRAVLWDVVVAKTHQGQGIGKRIIENLLSRPCIEKAERVYLMTTNSSEFYEKIGFAEVKSQKLMMIERKSG